MEEKSIFRKDDIEYAVVFYCGSRTEEVLRLDDKGMTYKGVLIEDAGEAYRAFMEAMKMISENK
jgi:hypothetical protein